MMASDMLTTDSHGNYHPENTNNVARAASLKSILEGSR